MSKVIKLHPYSLTSKWGFDDGDVAYQPLANWAQNSYWGKLWEEENSDLGYYLHSHTLLARMIEIKILPTLPKEMREHIEFTQSIHNPIMLDVESYQEKTREKIDFENLLENYPTVDFTQDEINTICEDLFPPRGKGYLKLNSTLLNSYGPHKPTPLYHRYLSNGYKFNIPARLVKELLNNYLASCKDEEFEILSIIYDNQESEEEFFSALNIAKAL